MAVSDLNRSLLWNDSWAREQKPRRFQPGQEGKTTDQVTTGNSRALSNKFVKDVGGRGKRLSAQKAKGINAFY